MAQLTDLPNELLLLFFSYLPLKALIAARGVAGCWRQAIPHADILPARRALLQLYLKILASPLFIPTRPWVLSRLQSFDRREYLDTLLEKYQYLPEEFCLWVLEWPARAAIRGSWPGLPVCGSPRSIADDVESISGYNWLGSSPPHPSPMSFGHRPYGSISALCLWVGNGEATWLSLDKRENLCGKVFELYTDGYWLATEDSLMELENSYVGFIEWQRRLWRKVERKAEYRSFGMSANINAATTRGSGLHPKRQAVSSPVLPIQVQLVSMKHDSGDFQNIDTELSLDVPARNHTSGLVRG